ncbi:MAG: HDOD domain-containing protein [Nitrospira sp.]|nr:HDOD domain-containing protein [Nitrospira sp.]MBX7040190.1 HDOD domain-containing protein [Nitrospira sp.]MCW5794099.1 HDOD domain-containing protein [Nitrospira sp.]HMU31136.1 HDOD domain-containing protein [Nitrospira sp.]HMV56386.1 HDOD domain-containing protein [Nitrospira sp.]
MKPSANVDLRRRIEQVGELPTLPHVVQKLASMIGRPNVSAEEIGALIEKDQVLSAKVLRLANSPFYGFPSRIASVAHAVVVLGLSVVKGLTLCATAFDMMKNAGMNDLWRHSLGVAITAHILGAKAGMKNPEEVFVGGLLHDIGKVVLYVKWPDVGQQITAARKDGSRSLMETEQELFAVTHADVGGWLATAWHLPTTLREPILHHHMPTAAQDAKLQTAIVHVADVLVKGLACGNPGDDLIPPLSRQAWDLVGLDAQSLAQSLAQAAEEFQTIDDYL